MLFRAIENNAGNEHERIFLANFCTRNRERCGAKDADEGILRIDDR